MNSQNNSIRYFNRVQIKEGQEANFISIAKTMVEIIQREVGNVQCQAFYNEATRTMAWWETFKNVEGLMGHVGNPEMHEMQPQVFPLIDLGPIRYMGAVPDEFVTSMQDFGLSVEIGEPWPGTTRLHTAKAGEPGLQINFEAEWSDLDAARRIANLMTEATADRPGVLLLQYYHLGDNRVHVHQAYTDQEAFLEWATSEPSQAAAAELSTLLSNVKVEAFGSVDGEAKSFLDSWGATYYELCEGYTALSELNAMAVPA